MFTIRGAERQSEEEQEEEEDGEEEEEDTEEEEGGQTKMQQFQSCICHSVAVRMC